MVLAALVFAAALRGAARGAARHRARGPCVASIAAVAGVLAGWTVENMPVESLGFGGWLRSLALAVLAIAAPIAGAAALRERSPAPAFAEHHRREAKIACAIRWRECSGCC